MYSEVNASPQKILQLLVSANEENIDLGIQLARSQGLNPETGLESLAKIADKGRFQFFLEDIQPNFPQGILAHLPQLAQWVDWTWLPPKKPRFCFIEFIGEDFQVSYFEQEKAWMDILASEDFQERLNLPLDFIKNLSEYHEDFYMQYDIEPFREQEGLEAWDFLFAWSAAPPYHGHAFAFYAQQSA